MSRDEQNETLADTAFIFPGQGSQEPGMGEAFYEAWPEMQTAFDRLDTALDIDLYDLCFRRGTDELTQPRNAQPALLAAGYATYAGLTSQFEVVPAYVAGHSLGHFTALTAAGMASPADLVDVVRRRGRFMERAEREAGPGTMLAVLLADPDIITDACRDRDDVSVALYNGPRQTVISGTTEGVEAVQATLSDSATVRFRELQVGAAFHSPVMAPAVDRLKEVFTEISLAEATIPIVSDVSGQVYTDPAVARQDLTSQITASVDWVTVVEELQRCGVTRYVEFPPAGVLTALVDRMHPDAECYTLETPADAQELFA
ncbi:ACP S-malonyltransferase [Haloterrigena sp. SYSU A121-1]|uniref:[acyl-carrier-protein] S-malonyltransferase n=1 Tax=Haloterrigena gelatinilytica TaxID=2741724 RepID=A0A8J8KJV8_9EURY|nr:ACP S-malonyltransferase [Haloterrigena gelatinilytica]NUB93839.1 ACP S-malonyltransferase [Haloterrigena gelatinilytica]